MERKREGEYAFFSEEKQQRARPYCVISFDVHTGGGFKWVSARLSPIMSGQDGQGEGYSLHYPLTPALLAALLPSAVTTLHWVTVVHTHTHVDFTRTQTHFIDTH